MNLYVYYDESYMTSWISDEMSLEITDFLRDKGFHVLNAEELAEMMRKSVDENTCWRELAVFSRDIIPETICRSADGASPNELLRNYLDCGGTMLWFGDVPLYNIGRCASSSERLKERIKEELKRTNQSEAEILKLWRKKKDEKGRYADGCEMAVCFNVLGVVSLMARHTASRVSIKRKGKELGLCSSWYSKRPILVRGSNLRKRRPITLAKASKPYYMMPFERSIIDQKKERSISLNFLDLLSKVLGLIPALIAMGAALVLYGAGLATTLILSFLASSASLFLTYIIYWYFLSRATYAAAWFKNFNKRYPDSGFYRLWDFPPHKLAKSNLNELYNISMTITRRISRDNI